MYCPKCGAAVNPGTKFCGSCGNDLSASNQTNQTTIETTPQQLGAVSNNIQTEQPSIQNLNEPVVQNNPVANLGTNQAPMNNMPMNNNQGVTIPTPPNEPSYIQPGLNTPQPSKKSSSKTIIIVLIVIVALIAAAIGIISILPKSEAQKEAEQIERKFATDKPIPVTKDGKYGYINTKGKFIIQPIYEAAEEFKGDFTVVRTLKEEAGVEVNNYQIINSKGKVIKESIMPIKYITDDNKWIIDYALYDEKIKQISPKGTRVSYANEGYYIWVSDDAKTGGIMNGKGKKTYTYQFQENENYISVDVSETDETLSEKYCKMNIENDKYAIVNCDTGTMIMDYTENYVTVKDDNIFSVCKEDSYSTDYYLYVQDNKIAYRTPTGSGYDISLTYYPGYVQIRDSNKAYSERYTYLHTSTLKEEKEAPEDADEDEEDIDEWEKLTSNKKFTCSDGYGLINEEKIVLACEYDLLKYVEIDLYKYLKSEKKNYIYANKDDKWYLIDLDTKKTLFEFNTSYIYQETGTSFMSYKEQDTKELKIFNIITGNTLTVSNPDDVYDYYYSNYIKIKSRDGKTIKYYNTDLELIYTETK